MKRSLKRAVFVMIQERKQIHIQVIIKLFIIILKASKIVRKCLIINLESMYASIATNLDIKSMNVQIILEKIIINTKVSWRNYKALNMMKIL